MILNIMTGILLLICSITDIKKQKIVIIFPLVWGLAGLLLRVCLYCESILYVGAGAAGGIGILMLSKVSKEAVGKGDGILLVATGLLLGNRRNFVLIMGSFLLAACVGSILMLIKRAGRKTRIPFAPLITAVFWGMALL